ncbi:MAG TPA: esterase-like activity of phytase family protein [Polyangiales bacterium]|nr:esterase-like activity of phytase family protein [Polyangiales bacterium]
MSNSTGARGWLALALMAGCAAPTASDEALGASAAALTLAPPQLIAIGTLDGSGPDRSSETAAPLENGVIGNLLGGIGSGLEYLGGRTFLALPDRGPNALEYQTAVDNTTSYIPRFHTLRLSLRANRADAALPYTLTPQLLDTTLLYTRDALTYGSGKEVELGDGTPALNTRRLHYFSGRSDNFDPTKPSTFAGHGRFDPEGIRVSRDRRFVYITDEYGPFVYEFERSSGRRTRVFALPSEFASTQLNAVGDTEIELNTAGRVSNKGMEGLAITPDGRTLIGAMQSPLAQDGGVAARYLRLVSIDLRSGAIDQYAYELTNIGTAEKPKYPTVSEILAINDHEFLVDERDGKGLGDDSEAKYKRIYHVDLRAAQEVSDIFGEADLTGKAVAKTLYLDVVTALAAHGIAGTDVPAKLEGLAFGPDLRIGGVRKHTLFISTDNDFLPTLTDTAHPAGIANPNTFYVFAIDARSMPSVTADLDDPS